MTSESRYDDLLTGSYDCVDRIVLNAYYPLGHGPGGFRVWWRRLHDDSEEQLDDNHLMRMAGRFTRRVKAWGAATEVPVIYCKSGERKHRIAEEYLATHDAVKPSQDRSGTPRTNTVIQQSPSTRTRGPSYDVEHWATDLEAVARHLGYDRFLFFGYSFTGAFGPWLARRLRSTDAVVAVASGGFPLIGDYRVTLADVEKQARALRAGSSRKGAGATKI